MQDKEKETSPATGAAQRDGEVGQAPTTAGDQLEADSSSSKKYLTMRQAAFIGVGAMVGAGIFALLGAAGEVAGAAVWLSFLIAGVVAALQGDSFAKPASATGNSPAYPTG